MTRSWPEVELGTIATKLQDGPFGSNLKSSHYVEDGVRVVRLQNIGAGYFDDSNQAFIGCEHFKRLSKHECVPGDVLIATLGDPIVRAAVLPSTVSIALNKADCIQLRCHPDQAVPEYVSHYLNSPRALAHAEARSHGQTRPRVNLSQLRTVPIPLPPVAEQRRIAAILDAADALRVKRRRALAKLDTLTEAIFIDMFGDPVGNPKGWSEDRVLDDVAEIRSGITKGRTTGSSNLLDVPYLTVANVQDGFVRLNPLKTIEATTAEISRFALSPGDIVLTEGGDPDKLGRGAVWAGEVDPCIHQNHVFRVRVNGDCAIPEFISRLLGSDRGKRYFLRMAKQTTGIASINMKQLRAFPLIEPPIEVQREYTRRISELRVPHGQLVAGAERLEALFASLQQRAFRGEL